MRASVIDRVMESVGSFGGGRICHKCLMLESVSSLESREFLSTSPVLESVWSFVWGGGWGVGVGSLLKAPCSGLSALSLCGETLFQDLYWNLSHQSAGG